MECKCGCGGKLPDTQFRKKQAPLKTRRGKPTGYLRGHWNKEKRKDIVWFAGYAYLYLPNHPNAWKRKGYIKRSRVVMSEHLGRPLEEDEVVHHINGDKSDDRIDNLVVTRNAQHTGHHAKLRRKLPDKVCPICKNSFYKGTHHCTAVYCSRLCSLEQGRRTLAKLREAAQLSSNRPLAWR